MTEDTGDLLLKSMIAARARPAVLKTKLINFRSSYPQGPIFAVEGDDDKVIYSHWIRRVTPELAYEFFVCGGKRDVRSLKNALSRDLAGLEADVFFLVDRDFDDLDGFADDNSLFMLDRYSVENYLVSEDVLESCLREAFPCHGEQEIRSGICATFRKDYGEFLRVSKEINGRIFVGRRLKFDIDGLIPTSLTPVAIVSLGEIKRSDTKAAETIPFEGEPAEGELQILNSEFDELDPARRYRGKFAIKFFSTWLNLLVSEFRTPQVGLFGHLTAQAGGIRQAELTIGGFAARSSIPDGLSAFLASASHPSGVSVNA